MDFTAEHKMLLDGLRYSLREITDALTDWADDAMDKHGPDAVNPDPVALAVNLKVLADLARDAARARDHLASRMADVVKAHPATFREPLPGIGLIKVGPDTTKHVYDDDALRSKLAAVVTAEQTPEDAVLYALRCAGAGWRVTGLRALGIDPDRYRTTTHGTPKARIE